ncbi:hypothetical protein [Streptomyces sp. NBC_00385]|uniref:hypothetical protein n=1 Tax=Streptomyces sp. NBC_00385 TaxID=2975733 RepID=UPI002DD941CC|nr:hypothetical protein [Streptomyces sp. NBC_00385]WRZ04261.1 hypothetical protein OG959_13290 [Streptomyces sp. NBC_00385]
MVLEITDAEALSGTALESLAAEYGEPGGESAEERTHAETAVREDGAEALASLIDPFDLVSEVPGVELTQASWSSETIDYDPEDPDGWDLDDGRDEDGDGDGDDYADEGEEEGDGDGSTSGVPHNGEKDDKHGSTQRRA